MSELNEQTSAVGYNNADNEEESSFDVRQLWSILVLYKYWFIASVIVCVACAFVYLRYATPKYNISSKVLIKDREKRAYSSSSINSTFSELGLKNSSDGFDNEIEVLSTKTLNKKVVTDLKLYVSYFYESKIKNYEIYRKYSPYLVDLKGQLDSLSVPIKVEMIKGNKGLNVNITVKDYKQSASAVVLPANIVTPFGNVVIEENPLAYELLNNRIKLEEEKTKVDLMERNLIAYILPIERLAISYTSRLTVEPTSKTTTVALLSMNDNLPERGKDYLTKLVEIYNDEANIDNNIEATRTEEFIKERIDKISKELSENESELETYKRSSSIVDYDSDAKLTASQTMQYETQILEVSTQLELLKHLIEYVNDDKNNLKVIPTNIGLQDQALSQMITKYNEAVLERERLLRAATENSPSVVVVTSEAEGYFSGIKTSMQSSKRQLDLRLSDLKEQQSRYTGRISVYPTNERILGDIERSRQVKSDLYLMLLQKREENAIQLASTAYKAKVIEEPIIVGPVSPKNKIILLASLILGIVLPFVYYYVRNFFRFRIEGAEDIAKLTKIPMLGSVPNIKVLSKNERTIVVEENRNSLMVEVYRALRSNLPFVLPEGKKVILFTSTSSGEGKTSIASNLGASIAFVGKKVLLIGLDIRKPRLAALFNLPDTERGISSYLTKRADDVDYLDSLIQKSGVSANLDILPSGPIPPNPAELLEKDNLKTAIEYLKKKYDYIIMDTPPVGMVTDTITIAKSADLTLYVVRSNFSLKSDMELLNELHDDKRLPNINIVLNAVEFKKEGKGYGYYGHYGYGRGKGKSYGYNYGYGYGLKKGESLEEV